MPGQGWPEGDNFALPLCQIVSRFGVVVTQDCASLFHSRFTDRLVNVHFGGLRIAK